MGSGKQTYNRQNLIMIPYGKQEITEDDIEAVVKVLRSDFITQGPVIPKFETAVANYCGADHAVAVNSATSALHIACLALGVSKGDVVWTSPISFVASSNCALYCGANIDFVDINPMTYNLSVEKLEEKLEEAEKKGVLPKVVIPVHLTGQSCEMEKIHSLSKIYGFKIIEDASHAIGGRYQDRPIGGCDYSDVTVFSFHPVKIITTGEGGMALTNDKAIAEKLSLLRSHGVTRDPDCLNNNDGGPWYYEQINLGFNYRLTDLQAALGLSQLERLDDYVSQRHELSKTYNEALETLPLTLPEQHPDTYSGLHLYVIRLKLDLINKTHREVFEELRTKGIGVNLHYIPIHTQPFYQSLGFKWGDYPEAEKYYSEAISLPMYPTLKKQGEVIQTVSQLVS